MQHLSDFSAYQRCCQFICTLLEPNNSVLRIISEIIVKNRQAKLEEQRYSEESASRPRRTALY